MSSGIIPQWFPGCWTNDSELSFYWWDERTLNMLVLFSKCSLTSWIPLGKKKKWKHKVLTWEYVIRWKKSWSWKCEILQDAVDAVLSAHENINLLLYVEERRLWCENGTSYLGRKVSINHRGKEIINWKFCKVSFPNWGRILANMTSEALLLEKCACLW